MLGFVARTFRGGLSGILWLVLIGCAIGGAIGIYSITWVEGYAFLGFLAGGIIGLITVILTGGLIANFLNMVDNIEKIEKHLSKTENTSIGSSFEANANYVSPPPKINYGDTWICKKCNDENQIASSSCKGCGEYK